MLDPRRTDRARFLDAEGLDSGSDRRKSGRDRALRRWRLFVKFPLQTAILAGMLGPNRSAPLRDGPGGRPSRENTDVSTIERLRYLGREATITGPGGMRVGVRILDVTEAYGRVRFKVAPLVGSGLANVEHVELAPYEPAPAGWGKTS